MLTLPSSWKKHLWEEIDKEYFQNIESFLELEVSEWKTVYPEKNNIFSALEHTPFENVKVVILWQDPYHWEKQAHWLSFSVTDWVKIPPSLRNIYKELIDDLWFNNTQFTSGDLSSWSTQWVLLLNSCLSVEAWQPASHSKIWWQKFTDTIISELSNNSEWIVFLLWWAFAQSKKVLINQDKHLVLETTHPSPFSAYRWFLGSKPFSQTNTYLEEKWKKPINWNSIKNKQSLF